MTSSNESNVVPYSVRLVFRYDQTFLEKEELRVLKEIFESESLLPAIQDSPGNIAVMPLEEVLERNFSNYKDEGYKLGNLAKIIGFPIITNFDPPSKPWCSFSWSVFKNEQVQVSFTGSIFTTYEERKRKHHEFAKIFHSFASKLYAATTPTDGYVLDPDVDSNAWNNTSAKKRILTTLNWLNFFGPEIVNKYGYDLLYGIPGYQVHQLANGGLLYQSRSSIVIENEIAHKRWQKSVTNYLSPHGIRITFRRVS